MDTLRTRLLPQHIVGIIAGLVPFFFFCGTTNTTTVNGQVVSSNAFNVVALVGGVIALAAAGSTFSTFSSPANHSNKTLWIALFAVLVVLGIVQIVRAFGVF